MARDALVITGATATGKTEVAIGVARRLGGEIISMDSRQIYRGMDVGTAKPEPGERGDIVHHGIDIVEPDQRFSAGRFAQHGWRWIEEIRARGHVPILAGGTGFFLRSLTHPMFDEPPLDPARKESWKQYLADLSPDRLKTWARALDPAAAARRGDRQRLARLIEVAVLTGRPLSWWHAQAPPDIRAIDPRVFVLELPRDVLYRRIEARVDNMIERGLVGEVRSLMGAGYDERSPGLNATGYIELVPHVRGQRTLEEAVAMIKAATRRYARRQTTWLRHQLPVDAVRLDAQEPAHVLADTIAAMWSKEKS